MHGFPDEDDNDVVLVSHDPLVYLIKPEGVTIGRFEAYEAFAGAVGRLRKLCPDVKFQFISAGFETIEGADPALSVIMAIAD
ncbi:MAG: hypothetical protein A2571_03370 [Candidatus Vogelbacteria bacterium RIFOXYD1_FULL_44_32]|uniref:Uncharacterized protein n=1 Tax=Candidatus Vogelbacteria bacterium RIFOXYD1_FULL_44_32 TaxID=1802438 RepID=A0A1G2QDY0_9BACT|nr:MAG: hypothetical protein A2571_03370 [Candidatus Vogelbacteria bacterium RIFOXYD1_FULL_44_32]